MNATSLHLQSATRQLTALSEMVEAMKAGPSNAALGNLAAEAELATMDLARTFGCLFGLAADAMCTEQDVKVVSIRSRLGAPRLYAVGSDGGAA